MGGAIPPALTVYAPPNARGPNLPVEKPHRRRLNVNQNFQINRLHKSLDTDEKLYQNGFMAYNQTLKYRQEQKRLQDLEEEAQKNRARAKALAEEEKKIEQERQSRLSADKQIKADIKEVQKHIKGIPGF